jgi:hypothetical protein
MGLIPKMGGVLSIWLTSTLMGLKYFSILGIGISLLTLLSVKPLINFKKDYSIVFPPILIGLALYTASINPVALPFLILYAFLFSSMKVVKNRRIITKAGGLALTFPFPMMGLVVNANVTIPLILLFGLTSFNLFLADSKIYGKISMKNYLSALFLAILLYFLSPFEMFISISSTAFFITFISNSLSLKKFGYSLLALHLIFAIEFLILSF